MDEERQGSIGTLTGWQLLAEQVKGVAAARHAAEGDSDDGDGGGSGDAAPGAAATTPRSKQQGGLHVRSLSNTSNLSEESGLGGSGASCVTPRPHQWLYREYKILDEIGSGGFGRVCRARRLADSRIVVVKEINTTSLSAKQKLATMDEVLVLAKLNHPNIVKYHDCYMDAVYINIVMEHCNAGDLAGLIKRREGRLMPEEEVMSLFVQIVLAMHYVHMAGVLHRDLKTSNVLIARSDNFGGMPLLKLGDFGVAKSTGAESSMASTIVGTPQYLSPEMCDNKPYGKKSDVWALGCVLYELCSLSKAFDIGNGGISGIILKIMRGVYEPLPGGYSSNMQGLVGCMLQVKPRNRPGIVDLLHMPYVRHHLALYLDWARHVPQAQPQVLQASLGDLWPRAGKGLPDQQTPPARLKSIGSGGSCTSLDTPPHTQQPASPAGPQQQQEQQQQQGQVAGSPRAGSSRGPTPTPNVLRVSGTGSNSSFLGPASGSAISADLLRQGSNMSSVRSGSTTPRSASALPPAGPSPAGSVAEQQQQLHPQQQQLQQQHSASPPGSSGDAFSGKGSPLSSRPPVAAGPPPGSLSGWLGGDTSLQQRMVIQQQVLAGVQDRQQHDQQPHLQQQQQQLSQPLGSLELSPQQQQQPQQRRQPRMSCPNPAEMDRLVMSAAAARQAQGQPHGGTAPASPNQLSAGAATSSASDAFASGWAYPSSAGIVTSTTGTRTTLAQEQMEGLKRIWGLKARLQMPHGAAASEPAAAGGAGAGAAAGSPLPMQRDQQASMNAAATYADAALNI